LGALALAVSVAVFGCGGGKGGTGTVTGKVTYKGAPLKGGRVTFAAGGKSGQGEIKEDGSYTAQNVPTGQAKVAVETSYLKQISRVPQYKPPKDQKFPEGYKPGGDPDAAKHFMAIPSKYESTESSGLTLDVKRGEQTFDIKLD
jgi:hypothetical protein